MKRTLIVAASLTAVLLLLIVAGCTKEKIVDSTEYVHDIEYVQLPADTVVEVSHVYDTVYVHDTVHTVEYQYDTVLTAECHPNEYLAIAALHYYTDPLVIEFVNQEFGYTDGWILYLSSFQLDVTQRSSSVYDLYGYIDYWAPDWSGYYPLEFLWRLTHVGGDPADPNNWQMSEPSSPVSGHWPGLRLVPEANRSHKALR